MSDSPPAAREARPQDARPKTVDGVEIVVGMKVYWHSGNPRTAEGVLVTSVDESDATFDDAGEELWVPLEWACSTREACKAFAAGAARKVMPSSDDVKAAEAHAAKEWMDVPWTKHARAQTVDDFLAGLAHARAAAPPPPAEAPTPTDEDRRPEPLALRELRKMGTKRGGPCAHEIRLNRQSVRELLRHIDGLAAATARVRDLEGERRQEAIDNAD